MAGKSPSEEEVIRQIWLRTQAMEFIPEELRQLDRMLSDNYFCNFSLFQSIPDSWAIKQLFPVMPIHRLTEMPDRNAVLSDITCDSDGKIEHFIDRQHAKPTLKLHKFDSSPYFLGAFLVGAYQEILGDLHNLFGDTNAVHVELSNAGEVVLDTIVPGETVRDVLDYVQFSDRDLIQRLQATVRHAVEDGQIEQTQGDEFMRFYENALNGCTYLSNEDILP